MPVRAAELFRQTSAGFAPDSLLGVTSASYRR